MKVDMYLPLYFYWAGRSTCQSHVKKAEGLEGRRGLRLSRESEFLTALQPVSGVLPPLFCLWWSEQSWKPTSHFFGDKARRGWPPSIEWGRDAPH